MRKLRWEEINNFLKITELTDSRVSTHVECAISLKPKFLTTAPLTPSLFYNLY